MIDTVGKYLGKTKEQDYKDLVLKISDLSEIGENGTLVKVVFPLVIS